MAGCSVGYGDDLCSSWKPGPFVSARAPRFLPMAYSAGAAYGSASEASLQIRALAPGGAAASVQPDTLPAQTAGQGKMSCEGVGESAEKA